MIGVVRPVRGVQVNGEMRVPAVEQADERKGLGRFHLDVIAVQIQSAGIFADAHAANRAILVRAVMDADFLVAVGVVNGRDENDELVQQGLKVTEEDAPGNLLHGLLALDLARVDVGHDEDDRLAGGAGRFGA